MALKIMSYHSVINHSPLTRQLESNSSLLFLMVWACFCFISISDSNTFSRGNAENSVGRSVFAIMRLLFCSRFKLRYICLLLIVRLSTMTLAFFGPFKARNIYTRASVCESPRLTRALNIRSKLNLTTSLIV